MYIPCVNRTCTYRDRSRPRRRVGARQTGDDGGDGNWLGCTCATDRRHRRTFLFLKRTRFNFFSIVFYSISLSLFIRLSIFPLRYLFHHTRAREHTHTLLSLFLSLVLRLDNYRFVSPSAGRRRWPTRRNKSGEKTSLRTIIIIILILLLLFLLLHRTRRAF